MSDMTQQLRSIANQAGPSSCSGALRTAADIIDKAVDRYQEAESEFIKLKEETQDMAFDESEAKIAYRNEMADTLGDLANRTDLDRNQLRGKLINLAAYLRNGGINA